MQFVMGTFESKAKKWGWGLQYQKNLLNFTEVLYDVFDVTFIQIKMLNIE